MSEFLGVGSTRLRFQDKYGERKETIWNKMFKLHNALWLHALDTIGEYDPFFFLIFDNFLVLLNSSQVLLCVVSAALTILSQQTETASECL